MTYTLKHTLWGGILNPQFTISWGCFLGVDNDLYMTSWRVAPQTLQAKVVEDGEAFLGAVVHAAVVKMPTAQPEPGSESSIWP